MKTLIQCTLLTSAVASKAITGTNIGGWLVLEPWITPSLFYRFLGKTKDDGIGMDSSSLCTALGPKEGNKLMRAHWDSWYTEEHIKDLANRGIEMVRLPMGDWTLNPYGPYKGCMDGSADKVTWLLDMCEKYNIKVFMDIHTAVGSQNGFDNSGSGNELMWLNSTHFNHWGSQSAYWHGQMEYSNQDVFTKWSGAHYTNRNYANYRWTLDQAEAFLKKWGSHKALAAYEPVNEPFPIGEGYDIRMLKDFYRAARKIVQKYAPQATFVFHEGFQNDVPGQHGWEIFDDLFDVNDREKVVFDYHYYQAFDVLDPKIEYTTEYRCNQIKEKMEKVASHKYDVWIGEWAIATDGCAHWLNGFQDGRDEPQYKCKAVDCPKSYLPEEHAVDFDRTADMLSPMGYWADEHKNDLVKNSRVIRNGKCWTDSDHFNHAETEQLARCYLKYYDEYIQGQFLWTGHNEIEERWDWIKAWDAGFVNTTALNDESTHWKNRESIPYFLQ